MDKSEAISIERLSRLAESYNIALQPLQLQQLEKYAALLLQWNKKINLTAITAAEEVEEKHFLDCLMLAALPEVQGSVADVGSGAGFPGIILKIYRPDISLTLFEPTQKRVLFLQTVLDELQLKADVQPLRAEQAARQGYRESFNLVTARAVAALPALAEYCLPLVRCGGWFVAMKGDVQAELHQAENAINVLGGAPSKVQQYSLPQAGRRSLVCVQKQKDTPPQYPRAGAAITKRPIT